MSEEQKEMSLSRKRERERERKNDRGERERERRRQAALCFLLSLFFSSRVKSVLFHSSGTNYNEGRKDGAKPKLFVNFRLGEKVWIKRAGVVALEV